MVDLQAGYKFNENLTASLTVNNVFDKKYYERVGGTSVFNFYDLPALSLPIAQPAGALPAGLMVVGRRGRDRDLLAIGAALQGLPALAA